MDHSCNGKNNETQGIDMGHRLLRGGRKPYPNHLSARQMDSLTALCDTLVPTIDVSSDDDEDRRIFYRTSASMIGVPEHFGGYASGRMNHPGLGMLRVVFWLLSTWFGTFILCGRASLSSRFPYFQKFSKVSQKKREEIMMSWALSSWNVFKMLFKSLKFIIHRLFFTLADEKNVNPSWRAIGYTGPDPDFVNEKQQTRQQKKEGGQEAEEKLGPLYKAIIDMGTPRSVLLKSFQKAGFSVSTSGPDDRRQNKALSPSLTIHCDVVVVGSGSGGGVVAGVLAQAGYKVLVLEKGGYYARHNLSLLEGPSMDQMYEEAGLLTSDDLCAVVLAGSTVGGGSTVNWSASIRTPPHVINEWSEYYGLDLFNRKAYKEAMDIICEKMGIQSEIQEEGFNNEVLRRGCLELGYSVNDIPRNSPSDHYCGWCNFGCKDGRKKSTQETWLMDLANSGNGVILPRCKALNVVVLHDEHVGFRNRATGVVFEFENEIGKKETHVIESKVTVVACGALSTPALLKRSGLRNPNIGKHLHIHPSILAWGYFPETSSGAGWPEAKKKSYEGGIMTAMSTVIANFETSGYGALIQTPTLHPGLFSTLTPWVSSIDFKERMIRYSRTAHIFALARDKGSGEVSHFPNSLKYRLDKVDEQNLKMALEKMLRILAAAGAEEIGTHHFKGDRLNVKCASSDELERFINEASRRGLKDHSNPISSAHQMGSCRMGVDPKKSVVNQRGETWEVEGLFIADSSVFPTALGVNPMVTVQAISYCTTQSILEFLKGIN